MNLADTILLTRCPTCERCAVRRVALETNLHGFLSGHMKVVLDVFCEQETRSVGGTRGGERLCLPSILNLTKSLTLSSW